MNYKDLANTIYPNITKTVEDYDVIYPKRNLKDGAVVTRFAPSPTGFVHMGSLFTAFVARKIATQTEGVFYVRIEDTDQKRSVENGIVNIIRDLQVYGINPDEGMLNETESIGEYGPYIQSERREIYHAFVKSLIEKGLAYPCFLTAEELDEMRSIQEAGKERVGCYGGYARYRELAVEDAISKINSGEEYVIRLKSPGNFDKKIIVNDLIRGKVEVPENDLDIVLIKGDGLPTYHFAHIVDDYLMRTTHVIRGEEWFPSLPLHIQLFQVFNFQLPKFVHISPMMKIDENGSRRKLSKRKDAEAAVSYYHEAGIPVEAVKIYLMTVANSNFELWYDNNQDSTIDDFTFDFKKASASGALFDIEKIISLSKNYISKLPATEVYDSTLKYALEFQNDFAELLKKYKEYSTAIFNIEREKKKPRKDYASYKDIKDQVWYMYDELFIGDISYEFASIQDREEIKNILKTYIDEYYDEQDDADTWFSKVKLLTDALGYCSDMKKYKENPDDYKGNVADISTVIRVALTSKSNTPNLYDLMSLMKRDRIVKRFNKFL